jgi:pSer/pThr/pTyr-binding forkhead associated (FHA) protein
MVFRMAQPISLHVIGDDVDHIRITIPVGETVIGREPEDGVEISYQSISREHAILANYGGQWFFQDLESTNGSWINGLEAAPREWAILRHHDYLQLADRVFRIHFDGDEHAQTSAAGIPVMNSYARSLFVFRDGTFEREIPMPQDSKQLKVGGDGCDLPLRTDISSSPGLVLNQRGESLVAYSVELEHKTVLNRDLLLRTSELYDRDVIQIGEYLIIIHDPPLLDRTGVGAGFSAGSGGTRTDLREWIESEKPNLQTFKAANQEGHLAEDGSEPVVELAFVANERATVMFSEEDVPFSLGEWESAHEDGEVSFSRRPTLVGQFGRLREEANEVAHYDSLHASHSDSSKDIRAVSGERLIFFIAILLFLLLFVVVAWWLFLS